jgi:hypothetical protein
MNISRRGLMISGAAGSAALSLCGKRASALQRSDSESELCLRLLRLARLPFDASNIGLAYLISHPAEAGRERLARLVLSRLSQGGYAAAIGDHRSLGLAVAACLRDDFACGHTVNVDGWVLSRTEARLCAWSALT